MKAIVFDQYGTPDVLRLAEIAKPSPAPDEVLVKVAASSLNDWDKGNMRGLPIVNRMMTGGLLRPKNFVPGVDLAGRVEAVGSQVTKFQPGDAVFGDLSASGFGAWAEYVAVRESGLLHKPESLSFEQAAL
jgi:NADPH:quinone reductase-like Zn-dependent oxidoreductase